MANDGIGKNYQPGDTVFREGDLGDCMYVIQSGQVEVVRMKAEGETRLAVLREGDFFGEMALFERELRSATVRAIHESRILTIDKKTFLRRVNEDPSLAWRITQTLSKRIRTMNAELVRLKGKDSITAEWRRPDSAPPPAAA